MHAALGARATGACEACTFLLPSAERSGPGTAPALACVGEELQLPTTSPGARVQVMQPEEEYCILGLVVSGDLIFLHVESQSRQPPRRPRVSPCCSAHQFPNLLLQELHSSTLLPSRLRSQSCLLHFCLPVDNGPGPPSPSSTHSHGDSRRWWEQCRPVRWAPGQRAAAAASSSLGRAQIAPGPRGERYKPRRAVFHAGGVKEQGTVVSGYFRLRNRHRLFQRSSIASISRSEGNF